MFLRWIIGSLLGAIVLFVWGFVYWVQTPMPFFMFKAAPNGEALAATLKENIKEPGAYIFPWPEETTTPEAKEAAAKKVHEQQKQGPIVQLIFRPEGLDPMAPTMFALGFAHYFVSALIAGLLLLMFLPGKPSYPSRVMVVFLAGLLGAVSIHLSNPIWFHQPWDHNLFWTAFSASNWLLAGIVMSMVIRPRWETGANA
jgi:hypothetical protein